MKKYHIYALSTAPWHNPSAWSDKVKWIQRYFGEEKGSALYKRLILSHHKNLNQGDYLLMIALKMGRINSKANTYILVLNNLLTGTVYSLT